VTSEVVVVAEPVFELLLQDVERAEVLVLEAREETKADGAEEPLDLTAGGGIEGFAVEQCAADASAGFGGEPGGEGGPVIAVETFGDSIGGDGVAESMEKVSGVLGEGEAGAGSESAVVVEDGAEDSPALTVVGFDVWAVHKVGDPEVVGMRHLKLGASPVGTAQGFVESTGLQETSQGGLADARTLGEHGVVVKELMEELDGEGAVLDAMTGDDLGGIVVEFTESAFVGAGFGQESIEAAMLVSAKPGTEGGDAEAMNRAVGQGMLPRGGASEGLGDDFMGEGAGGLADEAVAENGPIAGGGLLGSSAVFNHGGVSLNCGRGGARLLRRCDHVPRGRRDEGVVCGGVGARRPGTRRADERVLEDMTEGLSRTAWPVRARKAKSSPQNKVYCFLRFLGESV
jgi:hypothetical protein